MKDTRSLDRVLADVAYQGNPKAPVKLLWCEQDTVWEASRHRSVEEAKAVQRSGAEDALWPKKVVARILVVRTGEVLRLDGGTWVADPGFDVPKHL